MAPKEILGSRLSPADRKAIIPYLLRQWWGAHQAREKARRALQLFDFESDPGAQDKYLGEIKYHGHIMSFVSGSLKTLGYKGVETGEL